MSTQQETYSKLLGDVRIAFCMTCYFEQILIASFIFLSHLHFILCVIDTRVPYEPLIRDATFAVAAKFTSICLLGPAQIDFYDYHDVNHDDGNFTILSVLYFQQYHIERIIKFTQCVQNFPYASDAATNLLTVAQIFISHST